MERTYWGGASSSLVYVGYLPIFVLLSTLHGCGDSSGPSNTAGTGKAVLSWTASTVNEDGSSTELIGFRVYAGSSPDALQWVATVDAGQTAIVIEGLPLGTFHFAVTAVNVLGGESIFSNIMDKIIS